MSGMEKGLLVVLSAPSGGGKGTVVKALLERNRNIRLSVSATTRAPRPGEEDGAHYFFTSRERFLAEIESGGMLEHAEYVGNLYGTPKAPVDAWRAAGMDVILEIEVQGGRQIKAVAPDCVSIFLLPPSLPVLEARLRGRGTESEETVRRRLSQAPGEIAHAKDYDYVVVNDTVEEAVLNIESILRAERLRAARRGEIIERIAASC